MLTVNFLFSELLSCHPVSVYPENTKSKKLHHYIELCLTLPSKSLTPSAPEMVKRPRVRCQSEEIAQKASRHVSKILN
jgi:vacuolar protein sorting-associated protein 13D